MQQRPDIKVIVEPQFDPSFVKLTAYSNSSSTGYFLFTVANSTGTSSITMTAKAFDYQDALLGSKTQKQPFAVVNYAPLLQVFHVHGVQLRELERLREALRHARKVRREQPGILVRRERQHGADHGRERHPREGADQLVQLHGDGLGHQGKSHFRRHQPGPLLLERDRHRPWHKDHQHDLSRPHLLAEDREVLLHLERAGRSRATRAQGLEYFNVTELAVSKGFAGGNYGLFNTSYLYQPFYYSGYITVFTYGPSGLDPSDSVNISLVTPDPLDPHLLSSLNQTFGSYQEIAKDFEDDLFPAYSNVMSLEPVSSSGGRWVFLLNDTNLAMTERDADALPLHHRDRRRQGATPTPSPIAFSSFLINRTLIPSLPFSERGWILPGPA